jgi:hypothetical protein
VLGRKRAVSALGGAWSALSKAMQQALVATLVRGGSRDSADSSRAVARATLQKLPITVAHFVPLLQPLTCNSPSNPNKRARRLPHTGAPPMRTSNDGSGPQAAGSPKEQDMMKDRINLVVRDSIPALEALVTCPDIPEIHSLASELLQGLEGCRHEDASESATPLLLTLLARALPDALGGGLQSSDAVLKPLLRLLEGPESVVHMTEVLHVLALVASVQPQQVLSGILATLQLSGSEYSKVRSTVLRLKP